MDWKLGFAFYDPVDKEYKWVFRFSQLKISSDDGKNKLWLTFQPLTGQEQLTQITCSNNNNKLIKSESTEMKELICNSLQSLLYCMHSFLSAKVASVDPSFTQA